MWTDRYSDECRKHKDLIAAFESADGTIAVLLAQPLIPEPSGRQSWLRGTRRAAWAISQGFLALGHREQMLVLQWCALPAVAHVFEHWGCRHASDLSRFDQLVSECRPLVVDGESGGRRLLTPFGPEWGRRGSGPVDPWALDRWYRDMTDSWLSVQPAVRRQLVLATHRWIIDRTLRPVIEGGEPHIGELRPPGWLPVMLVGVIPPGAFPAWRPWIRLTLNDLRSVLRWPRDLWTQHWARWLLLIPYSVTVGTKEGPQRRVASRAEGARRASSEV